MAVKYPELEGFAFSFSHGKLKLDGVIYMGVSDISINQALEEGFVFGASQKVLRRSAGRMSAGDGTITFSDYELATEFLNGLGDKPLNKIFSAEWVLENESGVVKAVEAQACRMTAFNLSHSSGADALGLELPFSFLECKVNGKSLV